MKFNILNVYECPVAEIVSLTVESPVAVSNPQNVEDPNDPGTEIDITQG